VLVRRYRGDGFWHAIDERLRRGELSLRDAMQEEAASVPVSFDEAAALLEREVGFDPTFPAFVAACEARGMSLTIVSSGIEQIIRRRLAQHGVERLKVVAGALDTSGPQWSIRFPGDSPNGTDKARLVRDARERGERTLFAGDGRSDFEAALAADRVYAKSGSRLAAFLREREVAFVPFERFADITERLDSPA
jgi:HAD superfamily phosphoserine phosphatase-like hydrolase